MLSGYVFIKTKTLKSKDKQYMSLYITYRQHFHHVVIDNPPGRLHGLNKKIMNNMTIALSHYSNNEIIKTYSIVKFV